MRKNNDIVSWFKVGEVEKMSLKKYREQLAVKYDILPKNKILDGKGTWWEYELSLLGWNELPDDKKKGIFYEVYNNGMCILYFEALNHKTGIVYFDEIIILRKGTNVPLVELAK